jgi:hypothetical protein
MARLSIGKLNGVKRAFIENCMLQGEAELVSAPSGSGKLGKVGKLRNAKNVSIDPQRLATEEVLIFPLTDAERS